MSDEWEARKPDYRLRVKERDGKATATVGAAWSGKNGSISVRLSPGVSLVWNDGLLLTLFPIDEEHDR
jgi:hypothetical protein